MRLIKGDETNWQNHNSGAKSIPKIKLLQCVTAGTYYARCKANGKPIRNQFGYGCIFNSQMRCLECLQRTLVECLFQPKTAWEDLDESARNAASEKLDAMSTDEFAKEHCDNVAPVG